ncbi:hypothetical protein ACFQFH_01835 [Halobaculum halobium]|uniref:Uncharacterized protein n=1 Tax=Halobaculum halobium TaxID=3032281 RepID=A0ABD5T7Q8_9EURY|nr:hypothetical protein [Halobaculum sp. SYNS20]
METENSVIIDGAIHPYRSERAESVVFPRANADAGSVVANRRHDEHAVTLTHADRRVRTERRGFGPVVSGGAKLGAGTRLNLETVAGPSAATGTGEIVRRDVTPAVP